VTKHENKTNYLMLNITTSQFIESAWKRSILTELLESLLY